MRKGTLFLVFLVSFSGLVAAHEYADESLECWEQTMCHQPEGYSDVDFIDEVSIDGEGELWNGTIEIESVSFEHNVSEEIGETRFRSLDEQGDKQVVFDGVIQVESLCNEPVFNVENERASKYEIDVRGNDTYGVRSCYDHPTKVEYSLKLDTTSTDMKVIVNQNNITESFQTEDFHGFAGGVPKTSEDDSETGDSENRAQEQKVEGGGLFADVISIFSSLF